MQDHYKILQIDPAAEPEVIEAVYHRLARKYHPDVNRSPGANQRMKDINLAYETLHDPARRAEYDRLRSLTQAGETHRRPTARRRPDSAARPKRHRTNPEQEEAEAYRQRREAREAQEEWDRQQGEAAGSGQQGPTRSAAGSARRGKVERLRLEGEWYCFRIVYAPNFLKTMAAFKAAVPEPYRIGEASANTWRVHRRYEGVLAELFANFRAALNVVSSPSP